MIAIKRLQSIMWILIVAVGALAAYLISLSVATERNAVRDVGAQIYRTRANIRYLEVEFSARASMRQLETWNAQDIRYSVPTASQYLSSEAQLASLDRIAPSGKPFVAPPVMAAMARADVAPEPVRVAVRTDTSGDFSLIRSAVAAEPMAARPVTTTHAPAVQAIKASAQSAPATARMTRLALLDEKLLDATTLRRLAPADAGSAH